MHWFITKVEDSDPKELTFLLIAYTFQLLSDVAEMQGRQRITCRGTGEEEDTTAMLNVF